MNRRLDGYENPARARENLARLERVLSATSVLWIADLVGEQPDPDSALNTLERLVSAGSLDEARLNAARDVAHRLLVLLGHSPFLARHILNLEDPLAYLAALPALEIERSYDEFLADARATCLGARGDDEPDRAELMHRLRRVKYREITRIALREILTRDVRSTARELAWFAAAMLEVAYRGVRLELERRFGAAQLDSGERCGFAVIGMGKLGGEELNFSSDIDLIFVYESDHGKTAGGRSTAITLHEFFTKLSHGLGEVLAKPTDDGFVFRVDLGLRPEGQYGPVCNSLPACESYYETWGHTWERTAWIKARPVAGEIAVGERLVASLRPFVYRKYLDYSAIEEISRMKRAVETDARKTVGDGGAWNVKLGVGGIREIEFFVQALQLVYGGKLHGIRERSTLSALDRLAFSGLIKTRDQLALREAYLFLRQTEHQIQLENERQTHALPTHPRDLERLARRLGLQDLGELEAILDEHRAIVARLFSSLMPLSSAAGQPLEAEEEEAEISISGVFRDGELAQRRLDELRSRPSSAFHEGVRQRYPGLDRGLWSEVESAADPDQALLYLSEFIRVLGRRYNHYRFLVEQPDPRRLLITLFGTSPFLSKILLQQPDLLFHLLQAGTIHQRKSKAEYDAEIGEVLQGDAALEEQLISLRRYKNEEVLALGLADIGESLAPLELNLGLSELAHSILERAYALSLYDVRPRFGTPADGTLLVFGMGKLGGRELGYNSDLDLIFVYTGDGRARTDGPKSITAHEFYTRWMQRLISYLQSSMEHGRLYAVDTRLRPSGNQGTLVSSEEAFLRYHERDASLWERQALIKAAPMCGDTDAAQRLGAVIEAIVYQPIEADSATEHIRAMRQRMEKELAREVDDYYNLKLGRGGVVDIEFTVQYLQLRHGHRLEAIRGSSTVEALRALTEAGLVERHASSDLIEGYTFLRRLENRLRIVHDRSIERFAAQGAPLEMLARRMGYHRAGRQSAGERLLHDYQLKTRRVRELYEQLVR
ncbi:MAG: bifunctional [glutamate--ammonia ligase]-adenylyl-L-tyrosine phosphorylase/[glutamate--ammonia-ligase] adenylyltransferase [Myxococcales bacterium]|nr:bifunctional [glutamate--ammonia ligase]-adenylyl-L-tyrosine phosphorylase/[glutamate--ammonia-ligase] adenylyltransferase [Myxococcales bacterium]